MVLYNCTVFYRQNTPAPLATHATRSTTSKMAMVAKVARRRLVMDEFRRAKAMQATGGDAECSAARRVFVPPPLPCLVPHFSSYLGLRAPHGLFFACLFFACFSRACHFLVRVLRISWACWRTVSGGGGGGGAFIANLGVKLGHFGAPSTHHGKLLASTEDPNSNLQYSCTIQYGITSLRC